MDDKFLDLIPPAGMDEDSALSKIPEVDPNEEKALSNIPNASPDTEPVFRAMTPEDKASPSWRPSEEEVFNRQIQGLTDRIFEHATGIEPEKAIEAEKKLEQLMSRAPRVGMAFASPLLAAGFEALQQSKNAVVSAVKKENYSPLEQKMLTELLPENTPKPVKIGVGITEYLGEIALMGTLADRAKRGLLEKTIKEVGAKLEKAGYGTGKVTIDKAAIKEAVKGTSLEDETNRWLKAQQAQFPAKVQLSTPATAQPSDVGKPLEAITTKPLGGLPSNISSPIQSEANNMIQELAESEFEKGGAVRGDDGEFLRYASSYSSFPAWFKGLGRSQDEVKTALQKIIDDAGKDKGKLVEKLKEAILYRKVQGDTGVFDMPIDKDENFLTDLKQAGFNLPSDQGPEATAFEQFSQEQTQAENQAYLQDQQQRSEFEHQSLVDELGQYMVSEFAATPNLPNKAIVDNIGNFKESLGKQFIRNYGLTPEAKHAFTRLVESEEIRQSDILDFLKNNIRLTNDDAKLMTYHVENPSKYPLAENLKPQADIIQKTFDSIYSELNKRKLLSEKFPQSFINSLNDEIKAENDKIGELVDPGAIKEHQRKIVELKSRIDYLEQLHYVPHQYKPMMESLVVNLFKEGRISGKLIDTVSKIKGRKIATLDEAKELGLTPMDDVRVLLGTYMDYAFKKIAIHDFIESLKKNPSIVLEDKLAPEDWIKISLNQLDGFKVHPYLADAIKKYAVSPSDKGLLLNMYDSVNRLGKTLIFYNPFVMTLNNFQQTYLAGALNWNFPKYTWEAVKDFTHKTDFYKDTVKAGLFSAPYNTRPPMAEQIEGVIHKMEKDAQFRVIKRFINPAKMYDEIQRVTWSLDRIMRISTTRYFMKKGLSLQDSVDRTNLFMVDYSMLPDDLRIGLNRVFLTPTYRAGIARLYYNLARHPIQNKSAVGRLVGYWVATALVAAWAGYKWENGYRLVKKLKKPIVKDDGTELTEKVVVQPSPLFEYQKLFGRSLTSNLNLNLSRLPYLASTLAKNKDWKGDPVYDSALPLEDKSKQMIWYIIRTYFAPLEAFDRLENEQQDALEKVLNALAIPVYKRQSSMHYFIGQVSKIKGDMRDYLKRHPQETPEKIREVEIEAQRRMDRVMKKISDYEKME